MGSFKIRPPGTRYQFRKPCRWHSSHALRLTTSNSWGPRCCIPPLLPAYFDASSFLACSSPVLVTSAFAASLLRLSLGVTSITHSLGFTDTNTLLKITSRLHSSLHFHPAIVSTPAKMQKSSFSHRALGRVRLPRGGDRKANTPDAYVPLPLT